jgi:hypothetical protein
MLSEESENPAQVDRQDSVQDIVRLLLNSASAIQRLVDERDALHRRVDALERELTLLRHQSASILNSYRRLTTEFVTQFELIDSTVSKLFGGPTRSARVSRAEQSVEEAPPPDAA